MKRILSVILAILVCCSCFVSVLGVSAAEATAEPTFKELSISSNTEGIRYIVDEDGNPVHLFGMARLLSAVQAGANEEIADPAEFALKYKNLGMNYVRFAINLNDIGGVTIADGLSIKEYGEEIEYEDEEGNKYTEKEILSTTPMTDADIDAWIDEVLAPEIDAITAAGLYVCIDMHDYAPMMDADGAALTPSQATADAIINYCETNYLRVLKRIALKYKDNAGVPMIEIWNEPNYATEGSTAPGDTTWMNALGDYYVDAVTELRETGWDKILVVSDANAGWQHYTSIQWADRFDELYVGGNRNIAFSQHAGGGHLDASIEGNSADSYMALVGAYAMQDNYCPLFNEVEAECDETNTEAGLQYFCDWLESTKEQFHYSACLWRPRTEFENKHWVWGTNGWAADYTGGELVIDTYNWFETDGTNLGAAWKKNQQSGISVCYPSGDAAVGLHEDGYAYTVAVKCNESQRDIEFTRHWHYENDGSTPTDLHGGYDYIILKIKFPTNGSYDYAMGLSEGNNPFIRVDDAATASFDDYKTIAQVYSGDLKAGKYVYFALPLSNEINGLHRVVSLDNGFKWTDKGYSMHIATIDFATAEYVAENYAAYTPEGALAAEEELNQANSVNFFKGASVNGGDGSNWIQNSLGHSISNAWGLDMGNETDGYYAAATFNSKELPIRSGYDGDPAVDTTGMTYIKFRIKFNNPDNIEAALNMINGAGWIKVDDVVVADITALKAKLIAYKDYLIAGKYVDVAIPLTTEITSAKRLSIRFTDQWDSANALGIKYFIESIDFGNSAMAETSWLVDPANIQMYNAPTEEFNTSSMTDALNYGSWGQQLRGIPMQILAPDYALTIAWADRNLMMQKDWGEYSFNGMEYVMLKFKFNTPEIAKWALNNLQTPTDGIFASLANESLGTIATVSYASFRNAIEEVKYDLIKCEDYVTLYVPFDAKIEGVGSVKTPRLNVNFGVKWKNEGDVRVSILDAQVVNGKYAEYNEPVPALVENEVIKLVDDANFTLTGNQWYPQMTVSTKAGTLINSTAKTITMNIKTTDIETLLANTTYSSRGSESGGWTDGNGFKIYFSGTGVDKIGVNYSSFVAAFTADIRAKLAAGETVPVTFKLSGTVGCGEITGVNVMIAHGGTAANIEGCEFAMSDLYVNYNADTYFDKYDAADLDLDGAVAATDLIMVKKYMFDTAVKFENLSAGDANLDGKIDILDVIAVANKALVG